MITKFGTLFAGDVDMDDVGLEGMPVNDRSFSNEYLATVYDKAKAIAQLMDRVGFDTLWLAEHHFQLEGYECIPNIPMLSVHLAHVTERLKFGCAFNITPMWHPLRLAEDYATADVLTGGRVKFGVGRGYHTREVEVFDSPLIDRDANRELFEEQVEIIFKAFNQPSFSHHGKHYDIPAKVPYRGYQLEEITLVPRPLRLPVECWQPIVSGNQRGLDFMIKHGISGLIAAGGTEEKIITQWRDTLARFGRETELGANLIYEVSFHIADTPEKAMKEVKKYYEESVKMFGPLHMIGDLTDEQIEAVADPRKAPFAGLPTIDGEVAEGSWLCGPPELIIEKLMKVEENYPGLERVNVDNAIGTPRSEVLEQLDWFAKEVMPAFKDRIGAAAMEDN